MSAMESTVGVALGTRQRIRAPCRCAVDQRWTTTAKPPDSERPAHLAYRRDHLVGALGQVLPGEPEDGPTGCDQPVLAPPIPLEHLAGAVPRPAVDLDDEPEPGKDDVADADEVAPVVVDLYVRLPAGHLRPA